MEDNIRNLEAACQRMRRPQESIRLIDWLMETLDKPSASILRATFSNAKYPLRADGNTGDPRWAKAMDGVRAEVCYALDRIKKDRNINSDDGLASVLSVSRQTISKWRNNPETISSGNVDRLCELAHTTIMALRGTGEGEALFGRDIDFLLSAETFDADTVSMLYDLADEDARRAVTYALKTWLRCAINEDELSKAGRTIDVLADEVRSKRRQNVDGM